MCYNVVCHIFACGEKNGSHPLLEENRRLVIDEPIES